MRKYCRLNKPEIRIAKEHRSCNSCGAQNYYADSDVGTNARHVDKIYEVVIGHMVNALCPHCLRDLAASALADLSTSAGKTKINPMGSIEFCSVRYRDINGITQTVNGPQQFIYDWAAEAMTEEDEILEVYRNDACLYSALQSGRALTRDDMTGFFG